MAGCSRVGDGHGSGHGCRYSIALAERLGIVLNDELFASWEGQPVLIADQVETFDPDAEPATDTDLESE